MLLRLSTRWTSVFLPLVTFAVAGLSVSSSAALAQEKPYEIKGQRPIGDELVMVFMTSYACAGSNRPEVIEAVKELKHRVAAYADSAGRPFSAVAVSVGWDVERGIEHFKKYGVWDEVIAGRSWHNTAAVRYWHRHFKYDQPSTPQIILTEQQVEMRRGDVIKTTDSGEKIYGAVVDYGEEKLLYRADEAKKILEWASSEVAVPAEQFATSDRSP